MLFRSLLDDLEAGRISGLFNQAKSELNLGKKDTLAVWKLDPEVDDGYDFVSQRSAKQVTTLAMLCAPGVAVKLSDKLS